MFSFKLKSAKNRTPQNISRIQVFRSRGDCLIECSLYYISSGGNSAVPTKEAGNSYKE